MPPSCERSWVRLAVRPATAVAAVAILAAGCAAPARANGPASHVLRVQDVYFPAAPVTSEGAARALLTLTGRARASGWPLKVAILATPADLGPAARLFSAPQSYADLLARELGDPRLLVVTPGGFAGQKLGDGVDRALAPLAPVAAGDDRLERLALTAVARLARAAGHRLVVPRVDTSERGRRPHRSAVPGHAGRPAVAPPAPPRDGAGAQPAPWLYAAPLVVVLLALAGRALLGRSNTGRRRHADAAGE